MTNMAPVQEKLNPRLWGHFRQHPTVLMPRRSLLGGSAKIFAMGSCFAAELRKALTKSGYVVYPDYRSVEFDRTSEVFNHLPERDSIEHYDTFVIRQEFEAAFGVWHDRDRGIWDIKGMPVNKVLQSEIVFQEPCRKLIYAKTSEGAARLSTRIDDVIRIGIEQANVLVLTLGLIEVWRHNITGRYLCRPPYSGYGGRPDMATFHLSTFNENYDNVKATLDLILGRYPEKQIVLTVSPVPLEATHTKADVATANTESKAVLRAVAGQICREYAQNVSYFPAYEMATVMPWPVFKEDGRHVLPDFADRVVAAFMQAFG
jgi:hypothetical protein